MPHSGYILLPSNLRHPVTGILTTSINDFALQTAGRIQKELVYLSTLRNIIPGEVVVFTPWDIDWENRIIQGFVYFPTRNPDGGYWKKAQFPFPDVVYNQIYNRSSEREYREVINSLKTVTQGRLFNSGFFDKWQVYQQLVTLPAMSRFLPETRLFTDPACLHTMLDRYQTIFFKPSSGSLGKGIIKITRQSIYLAYLGEEIGGQVRSVEELYEVLFKYAEDEPYLVQQGLSLYTFQNRPVDIRTLMQKGGSGQWHLTKIFARVASGLVTTNIATGAQASSLSSAFGYSETKLKDLQKSIREMTFLTCQAFDKNWPEVVGELGIDIGLDKQKRLWIIEINSKPIRGTAGKGESIENAFLRPLEYAVFLAGQAVPPGGTTRQASLKNGKTITIRTRNHTFPRSGVRVAPPEKPIK